MYTYEYTCIYVCIYIPYSYIYIFIYRSLVGACLHNSFLGETNLTTSGGIATFDLALAKSGRYSVFFSARYSFDLLCWYKGTVTATFNQAQAQSGRFLSSKFTCFPSTKVQNLTQNALLGALRGSTSRICCWFSQVSPDVCRRMLYADVC